MPDILDATAPLLTIPDALASEAAAVLLGGDPGALKAVQEKLAAALSGQGLPEGAAGSVADGWMRDVAAGVGASATPDDAIAQASRIAAGTAARMAEAAQETAALTGEQRLAVALAQGQAIGQGLGAGGANDPKAASDLSAALFSGVMDPAARPAGAADPIAALSQALTAPPTTPAAVDAVPVSPSDKLAAALASGVGVQDAVTALGPGQGGHFAVALEHALSSGADAAGAIAEAQALSAAGAVQTNAVAVEQTDGARLLGALAAGKTDGAGGNPAFTSVLNDALAQGAQPDAALGASARAQTDMAARQEAAAVPAKPADALVASLSSGQNVAATVKTFAAAAGLDGAASAGFGEALGRALSSGQEMSGALGSAQQTVSTAMALSAESAKGVKSDGLIAALASGQNVQQAVQALGGSGAAFNAALGQALADGRAPGQALAAARQTAETVQQNAQGSEVPVSAENKALADLANPPPAGESAKDGAKGDGEKSGGEKTDEQVAEAPAEGNEDGKEEEGEKDGAKEEGAKEDGAKEDAKGEAADASAAEGEASPGEASPAAAKSSMGSEPALKPISFDAAGTAKSADTAAPSVTAPAPTTSAPTAAPPVTKALTSDPFAVAAQIQQQAARAIETAANALPATGGMPAIPTVPPVAAPTLSASFDAAAFAKSLAIAEGTAAPAGFAVFHLIEAMFRPGEAGSHVVGVAVVANPDSPFGVWQYSVDGGAWLAVGAVGDGSALVLPDSALLRFLPAANWNGTAPSLGLRAVNDAWAEGFSGAEHRLFSLAGVGGTTPLSGDVAPLTLEVTPVNGAPVATGAQAALAAIAEDNADPAGATVASLFGGLFSDPTDAVFGAAGNGFAGVVVVGNAATAAQGTWQYWTGTAWAGIGAASDANGLLLAANTALRFVPSANWNGTTPALTVRLVEDGGAPLVTGTRVDLTTGVGGSTAYSAGTIALTGTVTPVNDAPVATETTTVLPAIAEDADDPAGASVASLFGHLFSDPTDAVAGGSAADRFAGIAVVDNAATTQGVWQYWTGTAWADVGAASDGNALLLSADAKLRFLPAANWNGTTPALTVRLIDDSQGAVTSGGRVALTSVGGDSRYSAGTVALTGTVTPVNDAPVATGTAATLPTIAEDTANPAGATVASLFSHLFSDAADAVGGGSAADTLAGVVVVGNAATAAQGAWQYWTGSAWADIGAVGDGNGLLLAANTALRFVPATNWNGTTPTLTVRLVDTSQGPIASGARVDATSVGGDSRYSAGTIALTGTVTPVNDAPVATGTTATLPTIAEDTVNPTGTSVTALFGHLFSDPADAVAGGSSGNGFAGVAIVGNAATAAQGVWQYWSGSAWITVGAVAEGAALVVAASAMLRFVPAADWNGTTPALTVRLIEDGGAPVVTGGRVDLTGGVGGSTVYSADTIALTGTVTPVNDAPQITAGTTALATMKGVAVAVTGLSVSDVDAGALPMLVTLTAGHGTLTLASAGWDAVITGNGTDSVTIRATLATINGLLGAANGLLYTANSYTGADAIRIVVNDLGNGGAGGPLTATVTIGVTVAPPNASPILIDTNLDVAVAAEALAAPGAGTVGFAVSKLVGLNGSGPANVTDTDAGAVVGIALTGTNESYGRWWFSTDNGATWSLVGAVNDSDSALLLRATDRLYFQPNAAVPATVNGALTIRAWDQTTGSAGSKVAVTLGDGSAFSTATDTVTLHPGVLIPNGSFDKGLTGWSYTGGATVGATGDGHEGTLTSAAGQTPTQLEDFLGIAHGSIAAATGTIPSFGNAMKLASTVTVTKDTILTFDWTFIFSDPGYHDFAFVSVNGVVTLLAKEASASGTFSVVIPANTTLSLGFGTSDTSDNSVNPILRVDNVKLTTVASDPIVLDMAGDGLALRALTDGVLFDVSGDGVADRTGWVGKGNALLVRDDNQNGQIDDGRELVSEHFGKGFNSSLEALASLDSNHDGRIDAADESFATLQVWQDADGDGMSRPGELRTLAEAGILSIATTATPTDSTLAGNHILGTTSMTMADGSSRLVAGVAFDAQATAAAQLHSQPLVPSPQADHGRFDYAALLSSGLGLPDNIPVAQGSQDTLNGDWAMAFHTADTHHATTHASTIVPVPENS